MYMLQTKNLTEIIFMMLIKRFCDHSRDTGATPPIGVLGELYIDDVFYCYTIEKPWRDNKPFVSCVPAGEYKLEKFHSARYGETVVLVNPELDVVANKSEAGEGDRYACLIHAANWSHQLQGCIALGESINFGKHKKHKSNVMVTSSGKTLKKILPELIGESLLIRWKH